MRKEKQGTSLFQNLQAARGAVWLEMVIFPQTRRSALFDASTQQPAESTSSASCAQNRSHESLWDDRIPAVIRKTQRRLGSIDPYSL